MIVYGDRTEEVRSGDALAALAGDLRAVAEMPPGIARHGALAAGFVTLGMIVQGIADADRARDDGDGGSAAEAALLPTLVALGSALLASWESDFATPPALPTLPVLPDLPDPITLRLPEGYAFYGVYPEAYAIAARRLRLAGPPRIVGIRSIGTGLAAIVAAALDAPPPLTVRPTGHPFDRRIALTPTAEAALIDRDAHYIVVDEGPGLSGSSFAAVAGFLEARGIPPERIAFLPSHAGSPGAQASEPTRAHWAAAQRASVGMDELIPPERLAEWITPLIGAAESIEDVSGGSWRAHLYADEGNWPAIDAMQEKRKLLIHAGGERWLVKFSGVGREALRKRDRARRLHAAGFTAEVRGAAHGFLVQRWHDAAAVDLTANDVPDFAARYLGARVRLLPAAGSGASVQELFDMARFNIGQALGEGAAQTFAGRHPDLPALAARVRRVATDNRCDAHEWLRLADHRILKADALDHDVAHDLIGAQDLAWDAAGFAIEFGLDPDRSTRFLADLEAAAGRAIDRDLLAFLTPCYLAFRLGAAAMAAEALGGWPQEQARNQVAAARYAAALARLLA